MTKRERRYMEEKKFEKLKNLMVIDYMEHRVKAYVDKNYELMTVNVRFVK